MAFVNTLKKVGLFFLLILCGYFLIGLTLSIIAEILGLFHPEADGNIISSTAFVGGTAFIAYYFFYKGMRYAWRGLRKPSE